ncbi:MULTISPECIES: hypothetical protein [Cyanophyceae]|uniref:hypothetical protein n=1 Tax=Cyanophyceae TaxID=3028117 RepID=UPI0018EF52E6|nr:hypothetical protein [Trichocoleus sp. FACHB-69]
MLASQIEEVEEDAEKYKQLRKALTDYQLIVDGSFAAHYKTCRLRGAEKILLRQEKMHTLKNQFIVLPQGEDIVDVVSGELGKTNDINLFRKTSKQI